MKEIQEKLKSWRINRNMQNNTFIVDVEASNIIEECAEFLRAKNDNERIDALCDISVFSINSLHYLNSYCKGIRVYYRNHNYTIFDILENISKFEKQNKNDLISLLDEIITFSCVITENMGYNYKECMLETIKEISSRKQDATQKKEWEQNGVSGKWQKDKSQDKRTLYKADYEKCKIRR